MPNHDDGLREAIYDLTVDHPMWIDCDGNGLDYSPEREVRIADYLDSLSALLAPLIEAQAAVERVRELLRTAPERLIYQSVIRRALDDEL